jgi:hypothetical protein
MRCISSGLFGTLTLSIGAFVASFSAHAQVKIVQIEKSAGFDVKGVDKVTLTDRQTRDGWSISLTQDSLGKAHYRHYSFMSQGGMLTTYFFPPFNGVQSSAGVSGARLLYFFPRRNELTYSLSIDASELHVKVASGQMITFSTASGKITGIDGASWSEVDDGSPANKGGLSLSPTAGSLIVDLGFRQGEAPVRPDGFATVSDHKGGTCRILNIDFLEYSYSIEGGKRAIDTYRPKHTTDQALKDFLAKKCPKLDLSVLACDCDKRNLSEETKLTEFLKELEKLDGVLFKDAAERFAKPAP